MIKWIRNIFCKPPNTKTANMPLLILQRTVSTKEYTLGELKNHDGSFTLKTLEEPWNDNIPHISSIPTGLYLCVHHEGAKFSDVWEITGVQGRAAILIHTGNTTDDIEGCVLVGTRQGSIKGKTAVTQSREAMNRLRNYIGRDDSGRLRSFLLNVIRV